MSLTLTAIFVEHCLCWLFATNIAVTPQCTSFNNMNNVFSMLQSPTRPVTMAKSAITAQTQHVLELLIVWGMKTTASQKQVAGLQHYTLSCSTDLRSVESVASPVKVFQVQADTLNINLYFLSD